MQNPLQVVISQMAQASLAPAENIAKAAGLCSLHNLQQQSSRQDQGRNIFSVYSMALMLATRKQFALQTARSNEARFPVGLCISVLQPALFPPPL